MEQAEKEAASIRHHSLETQAMAVQVRSTFLDRNLQQLNRLTTKYKTMISE